jgi:hypothetical protein
MDLFAGAHLDGQYLFIERRDKYVRAAPANRKRTITEDRKKGRGGRKAPA